MTGVTTPSPAGVAISEWPVIEVWGSMGESGVCSLDEFLGVTGLAGPVGSCSMSLPSSLN
jgi:hypothetical protein